MTTLFLFTNGNFVVILALRNNIIIKDKFKIK